MKVLRFGDTDVLGAFQKDMREMWLEIDKSGLVSREIGFAADGSVLHKYPGDGPHGRHGLFEFVKFEPSTPGELPVEEFERKWAEPRIASEAEFEEKAGMFRRFFSLLSGR